jgi:prevent-host-death family protein
LLRRPEHQAFGAKPFDRWRRYLLNFNLRVVRANGNDTPEDRTRVVDFVAICSYISGVKTVSIRDAKNRLTELAREVERGETVVVTRNGRPAFDLVPHQTRKGLRLEAIDEFKRKHRIKAIVPYIADDFDEPLPEDFLLRPLPVDR